MTSVAYLTNIPTPYRVAMVEAWVKALGRDMHLDVYYTDPGDQGRGWSTRPIQGATETRLSGIFSIPKYGRLNRGLLALVRKHDVLMIGGFEQASYLIAAAIARLFGKKVILVFDGFSPKRFYSEKPAIVWVKRVTARLCDAYFANGTVGFRYLQKLNVSSSGIFNQFLSVSTRNIDDALSTGLSRKEFRTRFGLPAERKIVAFCGYMIERKRLDLLIQAVALQPENSRPVVAVIGTGPLQADVAKLALNLGVEALFVGFHEGSSLAQLYLAVDMLVLPSRDDPWGLVVNEAMAASLPVIVSNACGCAEDLVQPGSNGYVFRSGDVLHLAECLQKALAGDLLEMGVRSRSIIDNWTPMHSGTSLAACVAFVLPAVAASRKDDN